MLEAVSICGLNQNSDIMTSLKRMRGGEIGRCHTHAQIVIGSAVVGVQETELESEFIIPGLRIRIEEGHSPIRTIGSTDGCDDREGRDGLVTQIIKRKSVIDGTVVTILVE